MPLHLFIDTNVFLSFFHLSSDDLEELRKLAALVRRGEVALHLPQQVIHEFYRNRGSKIADGLKPLKQHKFKMQFPQICKDYAEYATLRDLQRDIEQAHAALLDRVDADIRDQRLKADSIIEELFAAVAAIPLSDALYGQARQRHAIGNPPGKRDSLGDAVNWESLLLSVPEGEDLYFVTGDTDYRSALDDESFNEFLVREWSERKRSDIHFFERLSRFFAGQFPEITLASEIEKELLVAKLAASPHFYTTHRIIAQLAAYSEFTDAQVNAIVAAALNNTQVKWIIQDPDVKTFLDSLIRRYASAIDKENLLAIQTELTPEPKPVDAPDADPAL